jgi:hypothetical protein
MTIRQWVAALVVGFAIAFAWTTDELWPASTPLDQRIIPAKQL